MKSPAFTHCPKCNAFPNRPCVGVRGQALSKFHKERIKAASEPVLAVIPTWNDYIVKPKDKYNKLVCIEAVFDCIDEDINEAVTHALDELRAHGYAVVTNKADIDIDIFDAHDVLDKRSVRHD